LLEIGCSTGIKLKWFQNIGWEVSGIEPNRKAADVAIKNGLSVNCGSVFDVDFPEQSYDVIIMDMVLEHLHDSVGALSLVSKWLKKDGQLIFSIPTFDGVEFKIYKDYAYPLQLPCHMVFFGKKNLEALLSGKFKDIRLVYQHVDRDFIASAFYRYREQGRFLDGIISRNKLVRVLLIKPLSLLLSVFSRTSRVTVFARKQ
jgi:SAM-dependent methyltransferase